MLTAGDLRDGCRVPVAITTTDTTSDTRLSVRRRRARPTSAGGASYWSGSPRRAAVGARSGRVRGRPSRLLLRARARRATCEPPRARCSSPFPRACRASRPSAPPTCRGRSGTRSPRVGAPATCAARARALRASRRRSRTPLPMPRAVLGLGLDAIGVAALHAGMPVVRAREVHDRLAEVRAERVGAHFAQPARDPHERLLGEVFGELALAGEEVREVHGARRLGAVELGQPVPAIGRSRAPSSSARPSHPVDAYVVAQVPGGGRFRRRRRGLQPASRSAMRRTPSPRSSSPSAKLTAGRSRARRTPHRARSRPSPLRAGPRTARAWSAGRRPPISRPSTPSNEGKQ